MRRAVLALLLGLLLCPSAPEAAGPPQRPKFRAVLVAGDGSLAVWDRGIARLRAGLDAAGALVPGHVAQFSARRDALPESVARAELPAVLAAIADLKPAKGEACLVYLTMHGTAHEGLFFEASQQHLTPAALDAALEEGCGEAPTFVVASGCYSGGFAAGPMARRNRVVFAAARRDLPSFGCHADFEVTVFDGCMLYALDSAPANTVVLNARLGDCVEAMEQRLRMQASHPQAWLGTGAPRLVPPFRAPPRS
jgi:hypothetical protein